MKIITWSLWFSIRQKTFLPVKQFLSWKMNLLVAALLDRSLSALIPCDLFTIWSLHWSAVRRLHHLTATVNKDWSYWRKIINLYLKVLVILVSVLVSGSWYQISCLSLQVISGTMNFTSFGTSLHSCHVTGSQASVPAHTWDTKQFYFRYFTKFYLSVVSFVCMIYGKNCWPWVCGHQTNCICCECCQWRHQL